jgi:hypothetical protein
VAERELQQSPNWDNLKDSEGFIEDGFPFREGFPRVGPLDNAVFLIIFRTGERLQSRVDFSTQYRAEGLRWEVGPPLNSLSQQVVAAWRELAPEAAK